MSFAGREAELRTLSRALCALRSAPSPSVVTVVGEAGIGKSAPLAAIGPAARDAGVRLLPARAAEHARAVPFALFADALGDVVAGMSARRRADLEADLAAVLPGLAVDHRPAEPPGPVERFRLHRAAAP
jgi:predicted ATPase